MSDSEFLEIILSFKPTFEPDQTPLSSINEDELVELSLALLRNWDEVTLGLKASQASEMILALMMEPIWLRISTLSYEQEGELIQACERITLSIPRLHAPREPMENGFFMLWDLYTGGGSEALNALGRLLEHPDERVQYAALHGLGHRGEGRIPLITKYMARHPELAKDQWVLSCLDGSVM